MAKAVQGVDRARRRIARLAPEVDRETTIANRRNAKDIVRVSKMMHPGSGENRAAIHARDVDGGAEVDFGPKSKVTEGDRGPRAFVNPALAWLRKRNKGRISRALNKAIKRAFSG